MFIQNPHRESKPLEQDSFLLTRAPNHFHIPETCLPEVFLRPQPANYIFHHNFQTALENRYPLVSVSPLLRPHDSTLILMPLHCTHDNINSSSGNKNAEHNSLQEVQFSPAKYFYYTLKFVPSRIALKRTSLIALGGSKSKEKAWKAMRSIQEAPGQMS